MLLKDHISNPGIQLSSFTSRGWQWAKRGENPPLFHFLCSMNGISSSTSCLCNTECRGKCFDPCVALCGCVHTRLGSGLRLSCFLPWSTLCQWRLHFSISIFLLTHKLYFKWIVLWCYDLNISTPKRILKLNPHYEKLREDQKEPWRKENVCTLSWLMD